MPGTGLTPQQETQLEARYGKYWYELVVERSYLEQWARHGIFPPPLSGDPTSVKSLQFMLALHDLWDLEGPPLDCTDEEGVEIQRARCEAEMRMISSQTTPIPGTSLLILGPAEG